MIKDQIDIAGLKRLYIDLLESIYRQTGKHPITCNHCTGKGFELVYTRNKLLILFGKVFPPNIQTAKDWSDVPLDQLKDYTMADLERWGCTEEEVTEKLEPYLFFQEWAKEQKYQSKQKVHLMEAFEAFEEEVYDICMSNIANSKAPQEVRDHFKGVLEKFKAWKNKEENLDVERAKAYPITSLVAQFSLEENGLGFHRNVKCILHEDSTASMKLYQNNTYYCFGCNQGGDTIDLLMRKRGVDFISAVKWLTNS